MTAPSSTHVLPVEDGYDLWLRYRPLANRERRAQYLKQFGRVFVAGQSATLDAAREELQRGLSGLLGTQPQWLTQPAEGALCLGRAAELSAPLRMDLAQRVTPLGSEGFALQRDGAEQSTILTAQSDVGVLYGVFHLLRQLQLGQDLSRLAVRETPKLPLRMLNHWDNPNGTVERGYAGFSLWNWHLLPEYRSPRYQDYARAMASVGLNATSLINVNSDARILTLPFLRKVQALAEVFRPYGLRVFLSARFSAPVELHGTVTADPQASEVQQWWRDKTREIYSLIPDFGGLLVKANSEGQPGPQDYGRSHAEGANLLADALAPWGGQVIWRAFVYDDKIPIDRAKQAYDELAPLDGSFAGNVLLQVKNGPIDFQPREPFHPLFGALKKTRTTVEFQLTQEYLGFASHLVYLAPLFKEVLLAETFATGPGASVAKVVEGRVFDGAPGGMAAVSNIGSERNWCGHPFAASNWYAFGRLAWNHELSAETIAEEWLRLTFSQDAQFIVIAQRMMLRSHALVVDTMTPLGLHHLMARSHHYGPGPWVSGGRADWTSVYYHRADAYGLGFDRSPSGSNAVAQYHEPLRQTFADPATCPEELLLWFHHLPWEHTLQSGRSLWDELCLRYQRGVEGSQEQRQDWAKLSPYVDAERHQHVSALLSIQENEARWWRDACLAYFQSFSQRPLPSGVPAPEHDLAYYEAIASYPVPGAPWLR